MALNEYAVADVAGAILDGTPIDWGAAESSADLDERPLLEQLRLLAAVAELHRQLPSGASAPVSNLFNADNSREGRADVAPAPEQWGHLRVLEPIGRGAFGIVYRAWETRLDREVALKLLPVSGGEDEFDSRSIIQEGRLLARVRHPNVVTIYGAERLDNRIGLWMELIKGRTLQHVVAQEGKRFGAAETVGIGLELGRAVEAVHKAGLLHRDVKAHNVMVADDGRIVLMDFGTGRELSDVSSAAAAGTPLYLAPEVLRGQPATIRSDIYSLGVLLYYLLTGSYPVAAAGLRDLRRAHEQYEGPQLRSVRPDLPRKLTAVIERALDPAPERRHESAASFAAALEALRARPQLPVWLRATAVAAAFLLAIGIVWEVGGRRTASSTPSTILAGMGLLPSTYAAPEDRPIIAVLPLKNHGTEPGGDYFVDGLTDEIIRNLAVIDGLQVRSQTSSFAFKDKPRDLREIGERLAANLVLEGSVSRAGNRLRINAQLVQVAGDVPLWSEKFDRELKDVFAIQDEISRAIVNRLRLTLGRGQRRYDTNVQAYDLYLRARALVAQRGPANAKEAAELFEEVIALDPAFAPAHAGLADAYAFMSTDIVAGMPFDIALARMRPAATRALELDPLLADAHAAFGLVYSRERDWVNAEKSFDRAIELNPSLTHVYSSYSVSTLIPLGKLEKAEMLGLAALNADPLSLDAQRSMALLQLTSGRYEEAIQLLRRMELVQPDFAYVDIFLARALTFAGRPDEALRTRWEDWRTRPGLNYWMAHALVMAGRRAEAEQLAAEHDHPFRLAIIYAALGDRVRALEALDRAADVLPHRTALILRCPELASLRGDPRLDAVRKKLKLP